jgi:2-polyprenyl-6-methoxyphenol hydroxylase-like FAD-dependent oxidoreductase
VKVERETELGSFADEGDRVVAEIRHADGRTETVETPWLIGCDGAHSAVRHGLKMGFEGETQSSDWILGDVHLDGVPGKEDELSIYWNPDGALVLIPIAPGRYRVIADVGEAKEAVLRADPTVAEIQAVLDQRGPGGMQVRDPIWLSAFRINERKVKDYCTGRVFLGGDAAHVHSPAGGQGMNTGMHDACNLAWKLAMVRNGQAKDWLLDNYSEERSEVGRTVLKDASRLTGVAIMRGNVFQAVRNHVAAVVFGLTPVRETMAKKFAELSIGYPHSRLTVGKHGHGLKPRAGERAPVRAGDGVGAGDVARFVLFADSTEEARRLVGKFSELVDGRLREGFSNEGIWLVRPDGYVSVAARAGEWEEMESFLAGLGVEGR